MQTAANTNPVCVHCTTVEVDERIIREDSVWQPAGRFKRKIGPASHRQGRNNQSVFIRGITITPNVSEQGKNEQQQPELLGMFAACTRFLNSIMGRSPKSDVIITHVPHISQVSHPSEVVNRYLLAKEPSAKIAVTHDSLWVAFLQTLKEGQSWTLEDLETHLETLIPEHYSMATHKGRGAIDMLS
ncbi:hypothetical protein OG21DRAFT_1048772 [Imleria badia]|nr:hypothetical protein OG21DRAFT_1048772 [Imleria badia]